MLFTRFLLPFPRSIVWNIFGVGCFYWIIFRVRMELKTSFKLSAAVTQVGFPLAWILWVAYSICNIWIFRSEPALHRPFFSPQEFCADFTAEGFPSSKSKPEYMKITPMCVVPCFWLRLPCSHLLDPSSFSQHPVCRQPSRHNSRQRAPGWVHGSFGVEFSLADIPDLHEHHHCWWSGK